jgi:putative ABC transport system permease protein
MTINGAPYTIIAITPSSFSAFPSPNTEMWALRAFKPEAGSRGHHGMFAIGRLKTNISLSQAQSQMDTIARRLAKEYPDTNASNGVRLTNLRDEIFGPARPIVTLLGVAVGIILLITCANLAGLLLGRVMAREREIGIRMALGARRSRIIRQAFTESIVLALAGGSLGIATAYAAIPPLVSTFGRFIPRPETVIINPTVLLFSAFITLGCGFLFGMMPAFVACSQDIPSRIGQPLLSRRRGKIGLSLRRVLVIAEVGLALALLIAAGMMFKSMWLLYRVDPGFDANNLLTFRIQSPASLYPTDVERVQLYQAIADRLAAIPGVQSVGSVNDLPFSGSRTTSSFEIEGMNRSGASMEADRRIASPGYFRTMGIPLRLGRNFADADDARAPMVAIVNEALVRKYLTGKNPLDQQLRVNGQKYRVVGVIGDLKHDDLTAADFPEIYLPLGQAASPDWTFVAIRYQGDTAIMSSQIRRIVAQIAPDQPIFSMQTMNERLSTWFAPRRSSAMLIGAFTVLALVLAAIGMYGVISYSVTLRTHEFGIRVALGATTTDILGLVLRQAVTMTSAAAVGGVLVSLSLNRLLSSLLYGVKPTDPFSIAIAIVAVALVAFSASYGPAHRAAEVDPIVALRYE